MTILLPVGARVVRVVGLSVRTGDAWSPASASGRAVPGVAPAALARGATVQPRRGAG